MTATTILWAQIIIECASIPLGLAYAIFIGRPVVARAFQISALVLGVLFGGSLVVAKVYVIRKASITEASIAQNPQHAVTILSDALRVDPASREALFKRGVAYLKLNDPQHAYVDLQQAREGSSWHSVQLIDLARAARDAGNMKQAISILSDVISKNPHDFDALTARGIAETAMSDPSSALRDFTASLDAASDDETRFYAHMNMAVVFAVLGSYDEEIKSLTAALNIHPDNPQALGELGNAYGQGIRVGLGSHEKALELADRALAIDPTSDIARGVRAAALFYLGKREEGISELSTVISRHPDEPTLLRERADMYAKVGEFDLATADLQAAQRIGGWRGTDPRRNLMERAL